MKMYTLMIAAAVSLAGAGMTLGQEAVSPTPATTQPGRGPRGERGEAAADRAAARAGRAEARAGRAGRRGETAEQRVDQREANQQKRIEEGIKHGQLTPDETAKLQGLETNIQTMEKNFESDGTLSKDEAKQLRQQLNEASLQIWAERHDTEGNQKPVSRLGKDVFAQDNITQQIESGQMTKADARTFLEDFRRLSVIKRQLANDTLSDAERTALQAEYNDLLTKYFTLSAPTTTAPAAVTH